MYKNEGKSFSFHHIVTPYTPTQRINEFKTPKNKGQLQKDNRSESQTYLQAKISNTTRLIKQRTIELVKTLRHYQVPSTLEAQIENYLTGVIDQMDLLQGTDIQKHNNICPVQQLDAAASFLQLEKPQGDQGEVNFEDTLRDITSEKNKLSEESQVALHDKIQNILKSIEGPTIEEDSMEQIQSQQETSQQNHRTTESRGKGAHKFSSMYLRDMQKPRKARIL